MILLLLAPGCATRYHQTALRERHSLEKTTLKQTGYDVPLYREKNITAQEIVRGITRDDTVRMALMTEPSLYAQLETLGISKADLAQAGFLQNPRIDTIFQFPRNAGAKGCIELDVTMTISDLWQIPMRKKVAEDKLAITSTALLQKILSVIEHAKQAYNRVLFETAQLQTTAIILETVEQLRNRIYQLQCAGYSSDFEVNYAQVAVGEWQTQVINQKKLLQNAYIDLRNTIGTETTTQPVFALETLTTQEFLLTNPFDLIDYAKQNKPETHINRLQIQQAQHQRSLEKSKIFNNVEFGIRFNRDPDGSKLTGPSIGFEMPFFDWNQAQIAKSRYEEKMARHDLESSFADIEVSVLQLYTTINSYIIP
jgi:cobalt-zinc-cadmium efflux system outer membrane protein